MANGTTTKETQRMITEIIRMKIEKQQLSIEKELKERLSKVKMELYDINTILNQLDSNHINLYIDSKKLNEIINQSKKLIKKLQQLHYKLKISMWCS